MDYSQQDAAQYNLTGLTSAGAGAVILTASAAAVMVGNGINIISGTNFTPGWYQILSVSVGVSITVDRSVTTGIGATGVGNIGGAMSLGSTLDDDMFETLVAGNTVWIKSGTYTLGESISMSNAGTGISPITISGYNATRGDNPTGNNRPLFDQGAIALVWGNNVDVNNLRHSGSASSVVTTGVRTKIVNCKFTNSSTTPGDAALNCASVTFVLNSELTSYRGNAIRHVAAAYIMGCYIHDSDIGISNGATNNPYQYHNNIIVGCVTGAISFNSAGITERGSVMGNTLYGAENKLGVGINYVGATSSSMLVMNNIVYGFVTGITHGSATQRGSFSNYNDFFNNTTDRTNWAAGVSSITTTPAFTNVTQVTGATATTSGSVLTQSGADFVTAGVTAGRDFIRLVSGTGITAGIYGITIVTATTLTLDIAPGTDATADKVFNITVGRNFRVGANMKAAGNPGSFNGINTVGYMDIGAVQRLEDYPAASDIKSGVIYSNGEQTGSYVAAGGGGSSKGHLGPNRF